jgi:hypothetical protein
MLIHSLPDVDGSRCILTVEEPQQWLRATWRGFVDSEEALRGADSYLKNLGGLRYTCLLNDNTGLHGPWFDSLEWLRRVWAPQAAQMGLRYIAHVVQTDTLHDTISDSIPVNCLFELQVFDRLDEAEEWLRTCQLREAALTPGPTAS